MEKLSEAELAILRFWRGYIRTKCDKSVRPVLLYYLMAEMLIEYTGKLPEKERPHRPVEAALNSIGCYEGTFSKWRKKWLSVWIGYKEK